MATYQQAQPQPQQQQQYQTPSTLGYMCCGAASPWDDLWGTPAPTDAQTPAQSSPPQDYNNPFSAFESEKRTDENLHTNRSAYSDARSVVSNDKSIDTTGSSVGINSLGGRSMRSTHSTRRSYLDGKTTHDIHREDKAKTRALKLQEALSNSGQQPKTQGASVLASDYAVHKFELRDKALDKDISKKTSRVNAAVQAIKETRKYLKDVLRTETSRRRKPKDPQTIPDMKHEAEQDKEEEAKKKSLYMISSGQYSHDEKAGLAIWTAHDLNKSSRKRSGNVKAIV